MSLRFAILGLLTHEELSGYEITKRFSQSVGHFWHARSQQIYPELARLEDDALVESRLIPQTGRPDKRLYTITPAGRARLAEWVLSPSPLTLVKDEFLVKVRSYGLVAPEAALRVLTEHRRMHEERLASFRQIAEEFDASDPARVDAGLLGPYLTLLAGISVEQAFVDWAHEAERFLAARVQASPGAAAGNDSPGA